MVYGVKVGIESNRRYFLDTIKAELPNLLPVDHAEINFEESNRRFSIKSYGKDKLKLKLDNEDTYFGTDPKNALDYFLSHLRIKIAEYAESRVFIHAGVVGWKGKAILLPARSFKGKSTLVAELVKIGADYYSDEYAVLDREGFVHPFPKMISLRGIIDKYVQKDFPPETFGKIGKKPIPVGLVLFTDFEENAEFKPELISVGQGVLEIIAHTLPIRFNPAFSLAVLNKIISRAVVAKSQRNDAPQFSKILIDYFERLLPKSNEK